MDGLQAVREGEDGGGVGDEVDLEEAVLLPAGRSAVAAALHERIVRIATDEEDHKDLSWTTDNQSTSIKYLSSHCMGSVTQTHQEGPRPFWDMVMTEVS